MSEYPQGLLVAGALPGNGIRSSAKARPIQMPDYFGLQDGLTR